MESLRRSAVIGLLWGDFDDATADLEAAAELAPERADVSSDLSVARLSRGQAQSDPHDFFLALRAANRALRLDPELLPAKFNRALALTRVRLLAPAAEAWTSYLQAERDPEWLLEAGRLRASVQNPPEFAEGLWDVFEEAARRQDVERMTTTVVRAPRWFREHAEEVLLVAWGEAAARGNELEASRLLLRVRWIRDGLASIHEDSTLARIVAQIERSRARDPDGLARIARGLEAYGQGLALASSDRYDAALARFDRAERLLSEAGSPVSKWATFRVAVCRYQRYDYGGATRLLTPLAAAAESDKQWALHGQVKLFLGLIELIEGDPAAALGHFETALSDFQELLEPRYQAKLLALMACCFDYLGQHEEAWRWLHSALDTEARSNGSIDERTATHLTGSWLALKEGEPEIALLFHEEVLRAARAMERPAAIAEALRGRAAILEDLRRIQDAQRDLQEARRILLDLGDEELARGIEGDLALIEGAIALDRSPTQALELFDEAVEIFRSTSYSYRLVLTLLERARLLIALGRPTLAERDLSDAISESERQRLSIHLPGHRVSYFDQIRALLDTMIDLQIHELDRPEAALEFSERARARVLWDWLKIQPVQEALALDVEAAIAPSQIDDRPCELPESGLVVEYAALPERLVIWSMEDCSQVVTMTVEIGAQSLDVLVEQFREALLQGQPHRSEALAVRLYKLLVRPFEARLVPDQPLVVIPDGPLHRLPFSLLRKPTTGRRLVQDHAVSRAPSLRVLAASLQRDQSLAQEREPRALIVTAPAFARGFHLLPPLSSGDIEAAIADFFPGSFVLREKEATKQAFFNLSRDVEIFHFGGHAVVNSDSPLLSYLLFSPDPEDPSGALYSGDLLGSRLPSLRLAVLASCESGLGRISNTEGVESLARPFLAAGVPGVIASLWPVDDQSTAEFFVSFYRKLSTTWDVAEALRETQIEHMESDPGNSHSLTWGAFVFIGAAFTS